MRTNQMEKINLMNRFARIGLVLVLTMVVSALMPQGWSSPADADAALSTLTQWQATPCSVGATSPQSCAGIALPAGSKRMMIISVTGYLSNTDAGTIITATYGGGSAATTIVEGYSLGRRFGWLGYIPEADLGLLTDGNSYTLNVSVVGSTTTVTGYHVNYAFYAGVDQTGGTTTFPSSGGAYINAVACDVPLTNVAGGTTVYALGGTNADMTYTNPTAGYTTRWDYFSTIDTYGMSRENTSAGAETVGVTPNNRAGCVAAVIAPDPCTETASVTLDAVPNPITGATTITATLGGSGGNSPQVQWRTDGGAWSGWQANGSTYNPPAGTTGTADFEAQATGFCGTIADPANPTSTTYNTTCSDPNLATLTITQPVNGSTTRGTRTVSVSVGNGQTASAMTNMQVLINGTWRNMSWSGSTWDYTWNSLADYPASAVSPVLGVTLDAQGKDPTCGTGTLVNATQLSVNVDNTDPSKLASCAGCHGYTGAFVDSASRNSTPGQFPGSHNKHVDQNGAVCSACHVAPGSENSSDFGHRNGSIDFQAGVGYSKGASVPQSNTDLTGTNLGNCSTASCHSSAYSSSSVPSPKWGTSGNCGTCHPISTTGAPGTGSHTAHLNAGKVCGDCHSGAVKDTSGGDTHTDGNIDVSVGSYPANVTKHTAGSGYSSCSTAPCHGTATWGGPPMSCTSCHSAALGNRRQVTATGTAADGTGGTTGGDFVRLSRHVTNGTATQIVTQWDCIICHLEGDPATGKTSANHTGTPNSNADVNLRNVDSYTTGWTWNKSGTITTAMRDDMDTFCMGCHDVNGASTIAVNNSNSGLLVGAAVTGVRTVTGASNANPNSVTVNLRPFNTNDNLQNGRDAAWAPAASTTLGTYRTSNYGRVLNVKDQFNSTNAAGSAWASHHNLNKFTKRYTTAAMNSTAWTSYVTKEGQALSETAGLHCSDCHINETNAHGSTNAWYMNQSKDTAAYAPGSEPDIAPTTSGNATSTTQRMCFRCHNSAVYASNGTSSTTARYSHNSSCASGSVGTSTSTQVFGATCFACHGGYSTATDGTLPRGGLGAIHGNNDNYNPGNGGTASKRYRFMSGGTMRFYNPNGTTAYSGTANWNTATSGGCYTVSTTTRDTFGGCTSHTSGRTFTKNSGAARNLDY